MRECAAVPVRVGPHTAMDTVIRWVCVMVEVGSGTDDGGMSTLPYTSSTLLVRNVLIICRVGKRVRERKEGRTVGFNDGVGTWTRGVDT